MARDKFGATKEKRRWRELYNKIIKITAPTAAIDKNLVNKRYLKNTALLLNINGTSFDAKNKSIENLPAPLKDSHCANKRYVDSLYSNASKNSIVTLNNTIDAKNSRIVNVAQAQEKYDCVNLTLAKNLITEAITQDPTKVKFNTDTHEVNAANFRITNVGVASHPDDALTLRSLPTSIYLNQNNQFNALGASIINVAPPRLDSDVVTLGFLKQYFRNPIL